MEEQEYIITVFSENKVGLLNQITTVFTSRDVNIESLTTSESALAGIHKFTIVVQVIFLRRIIYPLISSADG